MFAVRRWGLPVWGCALVCSATLGACDGEDPMETDVSIFDGDSDSNLALDPQDQAIDQATMLVLDPETLATHVESRLEREGDRDFYAVSLAEGQVLAVNLHGQGPTEGVPDTVVRIYGPERSLIAENDDLPYRMRGADSGLVIKATESETFFIEVLEYSDWAGENSVGGEDWYYRLDLMLVFPGDVNEGIRGDNDTLEAAISALEDPEAGCWFIDPFSDEEAAYTYLYTTGSLSEVGDQDYFGFRVDEESLSRGYLILEFSFLDGLNSTIDPVFELLDASGTVVASTADPVIHGSAVGFGIDTGLAWVVTEPGDYALHVADQAGSAGVSNWYAVIANAYSYSAPGVFTVHSAVEISDDPIHAAQPLTLVPSVTLEGFAYAYFAGWMGDSDIDVDTFDTFRIDENAEGRFLHVSVGTNALGSALEAELRFLDADGAQWLTVDQDSRNLAYDNDPAVYDVLVPEGTGDALYVVIQNMGEPSNTGAEGSKSSFYLGELFLSDLALYD